MNAKRDQNRVPTVQGVSSVDLLTPTDIAVNPSTGAVLIDAASLASGVYTPATKVVAPVGYPHKADYYTDGTADDVEIQAAINAVSALTPQITEATGAGCVEIMDGVYDISSQILIPKYINLRGQGQSTIFSPSGTGNMIKFVDVDSSPANPLYIEISNIRFYGNNLNITAINCGNYGEEFKINNCWFHKFNASSSCITTTTNKKFQITGCFFGGSNIQPASTFMGVGTCISLSSTGDVMILNNDFHQYKIGISGNTEKTHIIGNDFYSSQSTLSPNTICINLGTVGGGLQVAEIIGNTFSDTDTGIKCNQSSNFGGMNIVGNFFRNIEGNAIYLRGENHTVSNNYFQEVSRSLAGSNANAILLADGAQYIKVSNNNIYNTNTNMSYGINISDQSSGNNTITDNTVTGAQTGDIRNVIGQGNIIRNNNTTLLNSQGAHTLSVGRNQSTVGQSLTIQAGSAATNGLNLAAGELDLKSGIATGSGSQGVIRLYAATSGSTGLTDRSPSLIASVFGNGRVYLGSDASPSGTSDLSFNANLAKTINMIRHSTSNTAGNNLTLQAGGATSQATNKNGGNLILQGGIPTGSGTSQVLIKTYGPTAGVSGTLQSISLNAKGSGYSVSDILTISGGGANATATVNTVAVSGQLATITINSGGTGYAVSDVLTVAGGTGGTITVNVVDANGVILQATLTSQGSGYTAGSAQTITGGTGSSATFDTTIFATGAVLTISLTSIGTGYSLATGVATSYGGAGTGATVNIVPFDNADNSPTTKMTILGNGNVGIGVTSPTAYLHLAAGTATASTAPLKLTSGTNLTSPEAGTMEFDGTSFYLTPSTTRKTIAFTDFSNISGTLAVANGGTGATTASGARSNLGAVNIAGDTMTGPLTINTDGLYQFGVDVLLSPNETVTFQTNGSDKLVIDADGTTLITPDAGFGLLTSQYLRVGSTSAPSNTTAGDLTFVRGFGTSIALTGAITGATGFNGLVVTADTGTITTGVWNGTAIDHTKLTGIVQADVGGLTTASTPAFAGLSLGTGALNTVGNIEIDGSAARDITVVTSTSAAGSQLTIQSGQGFTGFAGGTLIIQTGGSGTGTNLGGGNVQIKTGAGTGNAGNIIQFFAGTDVGSGTTAQSVAEKFRISGTSGGRISLGGIAPSTDFDMSGEQARTMRTARRTASNTAGNTLTLQSGGATSGATDKNAGNLILTSGIATGTGSGSILFQTSKAQVSTNTTDNAVATVMTLDGTGNLRVGDSTTPTATLDVIGKLTVNSSGLVTRYNNVATTGEGVPAIYSSGRATGQTAANASVATYTLPATDGSFLVSANVLVTTSSAENFTVTVSYTDEGNTARTLTLNFQTIAGALGTAIAFANGAVPYEGIPTHLRCKASTTITIKTAAGGTYTGCTYNVEGMITQIS